MDFIVLSGTPGQDTEATLAAYKEATSDLLERADSDQAYEDIMNGLAHLDRDGRVVYYEGDFEHQRWYD